MKMDKKKEIEVQIKQCQTDIGKIAKEEERLQAELEALKEPVYSIGDRFEDADEDEVMLVMSDMNACIIVVRNDGYWWCKPKSCKNNRRITAAEFANMDNNNQLIRTWDSQKKVRIDRC